MGKKTIQEILARMREIRSQKKNVLTNYYFTYNNKPEILFDVIDGIDTVIFGVQEMYVYRVFYYSNNKKELLKLLCDIPEGAVLDVVTKEENLDTHWLEKADIFWYNTYGRFGSLLLPYEEQKRAYESNKLDMFYNEQYGEYAKETDVREIQKLLRKNFDTKTDYFFTDDELRKLIEEERVVVEREQGSIYFIFIFRIEGKKFYTNLLYNEGTADISYSVEKRLVLESLQRYGVKYIYFWAALDNKAALKRNGNPVADSYNYIFEKKGM